MAESMASFFCPITLELMTDPVIDPDGNSYERSAIEDWLKKNSTSPVTRTRLSVKDLRPNRALRTSIEEYRSQLSQDVIMKKVQTDADTNRNQASSELTITSSWANGLTHISIQPPTGIGARAPCDICCVIDTSGSMSTVVEIKTSDSDKERYGFSQLDLVEHALKTIVHSLTHRDRLSIVTFSNKAVILFKLLQMDNDGKSKALAALERLKPHGSTNLWDGLRVGLDVLTEQQRVTGSNVALFLLTDGCPNVAPPRGYIRTLTAYKQKTHFSCSINTFGFGYDLNSKLLEEIAEVGNMGSYAFIPDGSFVGTIFVNAIANLLAAVATNVQLIINSQTEIDPSLELTRCYLTTQSKKEEIQELRFELGSITSGQSKDILLPTTIEQRNMLQIEIVYQSAHGQKVNKSKLVQTTEADMMVITQHNYRLQLVHYIREALDSKRSAKKTKSADEETTALNNLKMLEKSMHSSSNDSYIGDLLKDLTEQVQQAFSRDDWFTKWGVHYLPSLTRAHLLQQCNNFKDPGVQHYGQGELFNTLRDEMDTIFCGLPAPKSSAIEQPAPTSAVQTKPVSNSPAAKRKKSAAPVAMSVFNDANNPCFHGSCTVRLIDGSIKLVKNIQRGDRLFPHGGTVNYVLRTVCTDGQAQMVVFDTGLIITPWHPVRLNGIDWILPCSLIISPTEMSCEAVYSFALDKGHSMLVNDIECVTLGHGFKANIVRHAYYGSDRVIEDLRIMDGQQNCTGFIEIQPSWVMRNKQTGLVSSIRQPLDTYTDCNAETVE